LTTNQSTAVNKILTL